MTNESNANDTKKQIGHPRAAKRSLEIRTPENREKLLELFATNHTWKEITEITGISDKAVRNWMRLDKTFYAEYIQAKEFGSDGYVDQIADLAVEVMQVETDENGVPLPTEKDKAQRVRAATDALARAAQMRAPKRFGNLLKIGDADGEKLQVFLPRFTCLVGPDGQPIDGGALEATDTSWVEMERDDQNQLTPKAGGKVIGNEEYVASGGTTAARATANPISNEQGDGDDGQEY